LTAGEFGPAHDRFPIFHPGSRINGYDGRTLAPVSPAVFGPFTGQILSQAK
jgi:hypothetical protein